MTIKNSRQAIEWIKKHPWCISYRNARERCKPTGLYGKRGIKFNMTIPDFKELWFRDKAWLLKRPSIDRINAKGDYIKSNCRFIELSENCRNKTERIYTKLSKIHKNRLRKSMKRWIKEHGHGTKKGYRKHKRDITKNSKT